MLIWLCFVCLQSGETDERIKQLEQDKEALQMQVSVLSEQIEAQSDKINELEKFLTEKKQMLGNAEDLLQRVRTLATFIASHIDKQKVFSFFQNNANA